jgi:UDP-glucose 4-epimerase
MNILLTGGVGYIGSHTAFLLIEQGFNVVLFDNLSNSHQNVVKQLEKLTSKKIPFVKGDIRDIDLLSSTLKNFKIEAVIHFAGLKAVNESAKDPLHYYDNNVGGSLNLFRAMEKNHIKKIVFSSSATVYGEPKYLPYDENHPTNAINPYGKTKLYIEQILNDLVQSDSEWSAICLRYFNPVGAHSSGLISENPLGIPNNLMPYILKVASGDFNQLNIFGSDYKTRDGTGERDYIHVEDLAAGHLAALKYIFNMKGWEAINLGSGKPTSVLELVRAFEKANSKNIPIKLTEKRQGDLPSYYANFDKAHKKLNWIPRKNLEDICQSAWKAHQLTGGLL